MSEPYNYTVFPTNLDADLFEAFPGVLKPGSRAVDGPLVGIDGSQTTLKALWKRQALVIEFGSFS